MASTVGLSMTTAIRVLENWTQMYTPYDGGSRNSVRVRSLSENAPFTEYPRLACYYKKYVPEGHLAAKWWFYKWSQDAQRWVFCGSHGWGYGGGWEKTVGRDTTGCGNGYYYYVEGGTYVLRGNEWLGNGDVTDYEYIWYFGK